MKRIIQFIKFMIERPTLTMVLLLLLLLLPLMIFRDFTPSNELRYLNIVDEALASGKLFAFTCHGEPYADKPPFFFWLMMLCRLVCGKHCMFAYSMLTLIPACVVIYVMDRWSTRAYGMNALERYATSSMLITSVMFLGMTVVIRMDMMMCMWIVLSLYLFWRMDNGISTSRLCLWLLPVLVFMALFTKGPVGLIMPVVSIAAWLVYAYRPRDIGRYLGWRFWTVLAVLCGLWFWGAWRDGGREYLENLLFHQTFDRAVNAFHHKEPFWYYGKVVWGVLAPWCLAAVPAIILGLRGRKDNVQNLQGGTCAFFSLTAVGCLLTLSLFSSKLSVYLGPMVPFAICAVPPMFRKYSEKSAVRLTVAVPAALYCIAGFGAMVAAVYLLAVGPSTVADALSVLDCITVLFWALIMLLNCIFYLVPKYRRQTLWSVSVNLVLCIMVTIGFASTDIFSINDWVGYGNLCADIEQDVPVHTLNVKRAENMSVYLGRDVHDYGQDVDAFLADPPEDGVLVVRISTLEDNPGLESFVSGRWQQRYGKFALIGIEKNTVHLSSRRVYPPELLRDLRKRPKSD